MSYDPNQYLEDHRKTWNEFIRLTIYAAASVVVLLVLLAIFLL